MGFSRHEDWNASSCPPPGDGFNPGGGSLDQSQCFQPATLLLGQQGLHQLYGCCSDCPEQLRPRAWGPTARPLPLGAAGGPGYLRCRCNLPGGVCTGFCCPQQRTCRRRRRQPPARHACPRAARSGPGT